MSTHLSVHPTPHLLYCAALSGAYILFSVHTNRHTDKSSTSPVVRSTRTTNENISVDKIKKQLLTRRIKDEMRFVVAVVVDDDDDHLLRHLLSVRVRCGGVIEKKNKQKMTTRNKPRRSGEWAAFSLLF